jgi:hypothetical protein
MPLEPLLIVNENTTVAANCLATDSLYALVYVTGPAINGLPQVATVDPTDSSKMPSIGMITNKSNDTDCDITLYGLVEIPGLTPNTRYIVGIDGEISSEIPVARPFLVQHVGVAQSEEKLLLNLPKELIGLR